MNKVLGKLTKEELENISSIKNIISKLKNQQEFLNIKLENVNLKIALEESFKKDLIKDTMIKFGIKNISDVLIKETGEIILKEENKKEPIVKYGNDKE